MTGTAERIAGMIALGEPYSRSGSWGLVIDFRPSAERSRTCANSFREGKNTQKYLPAP
jgi:hypothetical protein